MVCHETGMHPGVTSFDGGAIQTIKLKFDSWPFEIAVDPHKKS
jgi:hypothetical protein